MAYAYWVGIIAGVCFVLAFGMLNFGMLSAGSPLYQILNFFGALGFTYTAITPFNPGLFILEAIWAAVALYGIWKIWTKNKKPEAEIPSATPPSEP